MCDKEIRASEHLTSKSVLGMCFLGDVIPNSYCTFPGHLVSSVLPVVTINHQDDLGSQLYIPVCLTHQGRSSGSDHVS